MARDRQLQAAAAFEGALKILDWPYFRSICIYDYGRMLASTGGSEAAREKLAESLAILQRLGARLHIPEVERALIAVT
jgi:hypothetical protein